MKSFSLAAGLLMTLSPFVLAQDPENGRELYLFGDGGNSQACTACHDDEYFRASTNRMAGSLSELRGWVQGCNQSFPQGWFPEEEDDVAAFLNKEYYGFPGR